MGRTMKGKQRELDMYKIEDIVRDLIENIPIKQIARKRKISKNTVKRYRDILDSIALKYQPDFTNLGSVMDSLRIHRKQERYSDNFQWFALHQDFLSGLFKECKNHLLIFEQLKQSGFKGSYSSLLRYVKKNNLNPSRPVLRVETEPGLIAQVDFGYIGKIYDSDVKKQVKAYVFVMVLAFSRHAYYEIVTSQDIKTWCRCHINAFNHFGGVPKEIVPDNLKSAITKASLFDPIANRTYSDLASHYGFQINPCKPSTPEHKGKVESGVKYAKNNFLPLRTFTDVQDAERQIKEWNKTKAQVRIHGTTRQKPIEVFSAYEKDKLLPMDKEVFETPLYKELTVHTDSHIQFEQAYYSVPYELREQRVLARKTEAQLCVFYENKLVALHQSAKKGQRRTNKDHYPPNMFRYMQYDEEYCMEKAGEIGSGVLKLISSLLKENTVKNLRGAQNILRLEEKYTRQKLEKAVSRALYYGNYTYQGVKEILEKGLENETDFEEDNPLKNLSKDYARDLKQIIKEAVN